MKIKKLDDKTVQYFVGELRFLSINDKFEYENGQINKNKKIGSVIECIALNKEIYKVSLSKLKENVNLNGIEVFDVIEFENLCGTFWIKSIKNFSTIELSLKAEDVKTKEKIEEFKL